MKYTFNLCAVDFRSSTLLFITIFIVSHHRMKIFPNLCTRCFNNCYLFLLFIECHGHRFSYAPPRCRTSQYRRTFVPLSVSLWNDLGDPVFDGVGLASFKSKANSFLLAQLLAPFCLIRYLNNNSRMSKYVMEKLMQNVCSSINKKRPRGASLVYPGVVM